MLRWGRNWAAQCRLARTLGRHFRWDRAKRLYVHTSNYDNLLVVTYTALNYLNATTQHVRLPASRAAARRINLRGRLLDAAARWRALTSASKPAAASRGAAHSAVRFTIEVEDKLRVVDAHSWHAHVEAHQVLDVPAAREDDVQGAEALRR